MSELNSFTVGSYQPGAFIMKYFLKDFPYESALFSPMFIGDSDVNNFYSITKGGFTTTHRILTYLHEGNHYIQDLSLPACLSEDYFYDELSAFVHAAIEIGCTKFPLLSSENREYKWMPFIIHNINVHHFLFVQSHITSSNAKYSNLFDDIKFKQITDGRGLSYNDLLEGYVHYLSLVNLTDRALLCGKQEYLKAFKDNSTVFPYTYNEEKKYVDFSSAVTDDKYTYHIARLIFLFSNKGFNLTAALKYLQDEWPNEYRKQGNPLAFLDCAFFLLLDIALTIPAVVYIRELCKNGNYQIEDFSPVHRFLSELKIVEDNHGFPEKNENEPYYVTLFNFFANRLHWISYEDTIKGWDVFLRRTDQPNSDTSMGYRRRMFRAKNSKFHMFFFQEPFYQMQQTNIPLICVTRGGKVKIVKKYGNLDISFESVFDVYNTFNMPYVPWKEYDEKLNNSAEWVKIENENSESFFREIIYRIISRDIQKAILFKDSFTCSFYNKDYYDAIRNNSGFDTKLPPEIHCKAMDTCRCRKIKNFSELPQHGCAVRDYIKIMKYNTHNKHW